MQSVVSTVCKTAISASDRQSCATVSVRAARQWTALIDRPLPANLQSAIPIPHTGPQPQPCVQSIWAWQAGSLKNNSRLQLQSMVTGLTQTERVRLHYSICSLCSAGQLAECRAGVNDPRQSASANFRGRAVRVSPRISRILADLRPQADASASAHLWCRHNGMSTMSV